MRKPLSVDELKSARKPLRNVNVEHKERLTSLERFAVWITKKVGSVGFFVIILLWTILWLLWNTLGPLEYRFDPYPAFVLWIFISNMIQILFLPLLLIGQNLLGKHSEARAEAEYEIEMKAEKEIETILIHLENQNEILERLEKR